MLPASSRWRRPARNRAITGSCGFSGRFFALRLRDLSDRDYVYVWADGMHFRIRLEEDRLSALALIGVRPDGTKELITVGNGYRESTIPGDTLISNGPNSK